MTFSKNDLEKINAVTDKLFGEHRKWIEEFAEDLNMSFDDFMTDLADCLENGYSMHVGDNETDVPSELWVHYEALRGPVPQEAKDGFWFSCAC